MKYKFRGSMEIRFPQDTEFTADGDNRQEALVNLLTALIDNDQLLDYVKDDYLEVNKVRKVFVIEVTEVHTHRVEIDTDDYDDIEDEMDAERYVEQNMEDFEDDLTYDYYSRDSVETRCVDEREIEEKE